jgi:hypothetical protein
MRWPPTPTNCQSVRSPAGNRCSVPRIAPVFTRLRSSQSAFMYGLRIETFDARPRRQFGEGGSGAKYARPSLAAR